MSLHSDMFAARKARRERRKLEAAEDRARQTLAGLEELCPRKFEALNTPELWAYFQMLHREFNAALEAGTSEEFHGPLEDERNLAEEELLSRGKAGDPDVPAAW